MSKLYQMDPYLLQYRSEITGHVEQSGRVGVLIKDNIFYPAGGGQPADRGTLVCARRSYEVVDVEQTPAGIVHWLAGTDAPAVGAGIFMRVDAERRLDHMQQHHGQHIISAVFEQQYGWATTGFHLGEQTGTIDLAVSELSDQVLQQVEAEANQIVMENLPVQVKTYRRSELSPDLLQKVPPGEQEVRLVIIPGLDENPCCGTHPRYTGETGPIKLLKTEKVRGQVRLHFVCGGRTVHWMWQTYIWQRRLEQAIGAAGQEAVSRLAKRESELKKLQKERKELLQFKYHCLAEAQVPQALQVSGALVLLQHWPEADMDMLRGLAAAWCGKPGRVAVLAGGHGPYDLLLARGAGVAWPVNRLAEVLWPLCQGKGGGNAEVAQGKAQILPLPEMQQIIADFNRQFS
ncbi:alanyl-tRNA editing protein [Desulforamulus hydrothermalis]|uniref:Threonyl/alanyl tRNA synthetase SAD n=1 Tax=Desulforamulus hydrothermalis Lam5 = DSM 18033 TaxID=1121428 RepID=K8EL68_9FIRM|nr:alanine--tRNA ligase-related protein [Desulforamulus hydrothermalis]CCO09261.1 Threonyl/alanyl tRNA synthetase SAD [Desulforamulus hydrothermalis Lam5 = DSM 18033]SHH05406.1 alanyl-tRNA synthetase [Desulforamulus hydrothermalis Lam5 = DSM 18033]